MLDRGEKATESKPEKPRRLPTIRQCYEEQGQLAEKNSSTYEHYLDELVELEVEARRQNRVDRYLRESKLPLEKSWEAFDRKRLPRTGRRTARAHCSRARSSTGTRTSSRSSNPGQREDSPAVCYRTRAHPSRPSGSVHDVHLFWCRNC